MTKTSLPFNLMNQPPINQPNNLFPVPFSNPITSSLPLNPLSNTSSAPQQQQQNLFFPAPFNQQQNLTTVTTTNPTQQNVNLFGPSSTNQTNLF